MSLLQSLALLGSLWLVVAMPFRWGRYLTLAFACDLIAFAFARLMVCFATPQLGPVDNGDRLAVEPRLPGWLAWWQTPDNSLWGDHGWRTKHRPDDWHTPAGMAAWLRRNSAYGVRWTVLAAPMNPAAIEDEGDSQINRNNGRFGTYRAKMGPYWQWKCVAEAHAWHAAAAGFIISLWAVAAIPLSLWIAGLFALAALAAQGVAVFLLLTDKPYCWMINMGWLLDDTSQQRALFMASPRLAMVK